MANPGTAAALVVVADDYGYAPAYDAGILEAARAGAIDAVSAMAMRDPEPEPLLESGVEVGLHLELEDRIREEGAVEVEEVGLELARQLLRFGELFDRHPAYLDGHHHCHARSPGTALAVAGLARRERLAVRSVDAGHRRLLREHGVLTADRLLGRLTESEPAMPAELETWLRGQPPDGVTEWMVHPGHAGGGSSFDRGRAEDLELLLELGDRARWAGRGIARVAPSRALAACC